MSVNVRNHGERLCSSFRTKFRIQQLSRNAPHSGANRRYADGEKADAHAGEYIVDGKALPLLTVATGEAELRYVRRLLSSPAACHAPAMLVNLGETPLYYYPLDPVAKPFPVVTIFVESIVNRRTNAGELIARIDIVLEVLWHSRVLRLETNPAQTYPP